MRALIINTALSSESRLHGYYIGVDVMTVGLLLHQQGEKKKKTPTVAGKRMIQPLHLVGRK